VSVCMCFDTFALKVVCVRACVRVPICMCAFVLFSFEMSHLFLCLHRHLCWCVCSRCANTCVCDI